MDPNENKSVEPIENPVQPADEPSDLDQNNPVDCSQDVWSEIYSSPKYDMDNDHSMDL